MIDVDHYCSVTRISQDGPWPVFKVERTERRLGGAGNVARMCQSLGADVRLLGRMAWEDAKDSGMDGGIITSDHTVTKMRMIVDGRYAGVRLDSHDRNPLEHGDAERIAEEIHEYHPDAVIICDHGKGGVTRGLMDLMRSVTCDVYVDPVESTPMIDGTVIVFGEHESPNNPHYSAAGVLKLGSKGLTHWHCEEKEAGSMPSAARSVIDPLGAGDQFISALAVVRCHGVRWANAIRVANTAAGLQCERMGCVPVTRHELEAWPQ